MRLDDPMDPTSSERDKYSHFTDIHEVLSRYHIILLHIHLLFIVRSSYRVLFDLLYLCLSQQCQEIRVLDRAESQQNRVLDRVLKGVPNEMTEYQGMM